MLLQVVVGAAWLIWLSSGTAGLKNGLTVGAFLVMGLGVKNLLDTFWKHKDERKKEIREAGREYKETSRFSPLKRGSLSSPNWAAPHAGGSSDLSALRRFEQRFADPRL